MTPTPCCEGAPMTSETAKWLKSREDWLRVVAIPSPYGGFDVALVIDGSYSLDAGPRRVVRGHAERLMEALAADGVPLGRPAGVGVRLRVDSREQDAARRETARRDMDQAIVDRDLDGLFEAMGEVLGARWDEFADLEAAFDEDGDAL